MRPWRHFPQLQVKDHVTANCLGKGAGGGKGGGGGWTEGGTDGRGTLPSHRICNKRTTLLLFCFSFSSSSSSSFFRQPWNLKTACRNCFSGGLGVTADVRSWLLHRQKIGYAAESVA